MQKKLNLKNNIKLVIWDLDNTFWDGVLSEEGVVVRKDCKKIIKALTDRGIINSISSKNNYEDVKDKLTELRIWHLFVFPKINWNQKGPQIKQIIEECKLRAVNVLFIDDNQFNLEEAKAYCKGLNTATPDMISELLSSEYLNGTSDPDHTKLKQYKILEQKIISRKNFSTNEDFLYNSDIRVYICKNFEYQKERILELINKTNQLNYTKKRITEKELDDILENPAYRNYYIKVQDDYGSYGIIGFISIINKHAEHFLFSCRVIGMGVEQYIYSHFKYPEIDVKGEVAVELKKDYVPGWINLYRQFDKKQMPVINSSVLIRGACDLNAVLYYLNINNVAIETHIGEFEREQTVYAIDAYHKYPEINDLYDKVPFIAKNSFTTDIYSKKYDFIVMSVLSDYHKIIYSCKKNPKFLIAGSVCNKLISTFGENSMKWFFNNFENIGTISPGQLEKNLKFIRKHISKNVKLIIINGAEVYHENSGKNNLKNFISLNKVVDNFVANNQNTYLLDVRKFITSRKELTNCMSHYKRIVYYNMAMELANIINKFDN